ncbi:MAG: general secretion pathway protein GspM [Salinisphaeraceae bacterium]|jgi:general secretion pathway protein M|nr:general secretion pathway protein GspM [Salinisphaeraceae bacterium]
MKAWWASLAERERQILGLGGGVLLITLFFLLVWEPLGESIETLERQMASQQELNARLLQIAEEADAARASGAAATLKGQNQALFSVVDQSSRSAGLRDAITRIQPEGDDQAAVTLEAAGFNPLMFWLHTLEMEYGIGTASLSVSAADSNGEVDARLTLKRGG